MYEDSKLYFALVVGLFGYAIVSLVVNTFPFIRVLVIAGLGLGAVIIVFQYVAFVVFGNVTLDKRIPLRAVKQVAHDKQGRFSNPIFVVVYEKNNTSKKRVINLPYNWIPNTEAEFEKAKSIFKECGIETEEI